MGVRERDIASVGSLRIRNYRVPVMREILRRVLPSSRERRRSMKRGVLPRKAPLLAKGARNGEPPQGWASRLVPFRCEFRSSVFRFWRISLSWGGAVGHGVLRAATLVFGAQRVRLARIDIDGGRLPSAVVVYLRKPRMPILALALYSETG